MVNNCAGATLLALGALGRGGAAVVSRGELVEIGGGFRVPEIMRAVGLRAAGGRHHQPHPPRRLLRALGRASGRARSGSTARTSRWWDSPRCRRWRSSRRWRGARVALHRTTSAAARWTPRSGSSPRAEPARRRGADVVVLRRQAPRRAAGGHLAGQARAGGRVRPTPPQPRPARRQHAPCRAGGDAAPLPRRPRRRASRAGGPPCLAHRVCARRRRGLPSSSSRAESDARSSRRKGR